MSWISIFLHFPAKQVPLKQFLCATSNGTLFSHCNTFLQHFFKVKCWLVHLSLSDRRYKYLTFHNTENKQKN